MTLVKKKGHGMVKLVDDSKVPAMLAQGFEVLSPPKAPVEKPKKGGEKDGKNTN